MARLYTSKVINKALAMPILDPKCPWTCSDIDNIKAAVKQAYVDIAAVCDAHRSGGVSGAVQWAATVRMTAVLFLGAPIGRPGEVERLTMSGAPQFVSSGGNALERSDHKTVLTQGVSGKFILAATVKCLELFLTLLNRTGFLLEPATEKAKPPTQVANVLRRFYSEFNVFVGSPTLLRKRVASAVDCDDDGMAMKKMLARPQSSGGARSTFWLDEPELSLDALRTAYKRVLELTKRRCTKLMKHAAKKRLARHISDEAPSLAGGAVGSHSTASVVPVRDEKRNQIFPSKKIKAGPQAQKKTRKRKGQRASATGSTKSKAAPAQILCADLGKDRS